MRIVTYTCDLCGRDAKDGRSGDLRVIVQPTHNEPTIEINTMFTKPGADGESADLCNACKQQLLQKAIDTL